MKVRDLMTSDVRTCTPATNLGEAAALMLDGDCGILPVVENGLLLGVVTDRDLFIALGTRNQPAGDVQVGQVMGGAAYTCAPDDDVLDVLTTMKERRVRRLPVQGFGGAVAGIISINDIVLAVGGRKGIRDGDVAATLKAICAHHHPAPRIAAA
ncbi:MAG: CBS domain-containing protein [Vicinamibacterales bacterium]